MKKRRHRPQAGEPSAARGFDFGERQAAAATPSADFNHSLRQAKVFGCAYGFGSSPGFEGQLPCITLIGETAEGFQAASSQFSVWGSQTDGDVVAVSLLLRTDGSYEVWVGPEPRRAMYRLLPQVELCGPLFLGYSWIKKFDTTNPLVLKLKAYRRASVSPVLFGFAIADPMAFAPERLKPLEGVPPLLKFELEIVDQREDPDDPRFRVRNGGEPPSLGPAAASANARGYPDRRREVFDVAFPVSRERVRRSCLVERVRAITGFDSVSEDQVVQAAVNLMLSNEIMPGSRHYRGLGPDAPRRIWEHVFRWVELADNKPTPGDIAPALIVRQVELDVKHVLSSQGAYDAGQPFQSLQGQFRELGFIDD